MFRSRNFDHHVPNPMGIWNPQSGNCHPIPTTQYFRPQPSHNPPSSPPPKPFCMSSKDAACAPDLACTPCYKTQTYFYPRHSQIPTPTVILIITSPDPLTRKIYPYRRSSLSQKCGHDPITCHLITDKIPRGIPGGFARCVRATHMNSRSTCFSD